jgi:hypothetical protein
VTETATEALLVPEAGQPTTSSRWAPFVRDPGVRAGAVLAGLAIVGFVMFGLAWRGVARTFYVPLQLPWLLSGGFMALALLGLALGAGSIHLSRRDNAIHRAAFEDFVHDTAELAEKLRASRQSKPAPKRRRAPAKKA